MERYRTGIKPDIVIYRIVYEDTKWKRYAIIKTKT